MDHGNWQSAISIWGSFVLDLVVIKDGGERRGPSVLTYGVRSSESQIDGKNVFHAARKVEAPKLIQEFAEDVTQLTCNIVRIGKESAALLLNRICKIDSFPRGSK